MININNAMGEDTYSCKIKCHECETTITEALHIPESEKDVALLALIHSGVVRSHLNNCGNTKVDFEWTLTK